LWADEDVLQAAVMTMRRTAGSALSGRTGPASPGSPRRSSSRTEGWHRSSPPRRPGAPPSPGPCRPPLLCWPKAWNGRARSSKEPGLRIVSGDFRGKASIAPRGEATRPTSDRRGRRSSTSSSTRRGRPGMRDRG
jgi:hypothetical protein